SGGAGKTRLALQLAGQLLDRFDGTWFVDFSPVIAADFVPFAILSTLALREPSSSDVVSTLIDHLATKSVLLVLDSCEHVVGAVAELANAILRSCQNVRILVTSREPLSIAGEALYRIPSMTGAEAVRLFAVRASAVLPSFVVTAENEPVISQICKRLDGIPLAIELAAARIRILSVEQLWAHLDDRFRVLTGGSRTALPRHRTLRGLIAWSYNLLQHAEQALFLRLSTLVGDWPLPAATAIGSGAPIDDDEIFDLLTQLVDKSLVQAEQGEGEVRYRLLETTREYALETLLETGEADAVLRKHAAYWRQYAEVIARTWGTPKWDPLMKGLHDNYDNLRSALTWSLAERRDVNCGAAMAAALERFWYEAGPAREGLRWYEMALSLGETLEPPLRGKLLQGLARMSFALGDFITMRRAAEEAVAIFSVLDNLGDLARARNNLAIPLYYTGDPAGAKREWTAALELWRAVGDRRGESVVLANLAELSASYEMDFPAAEEYYRRALSLDPHLGTVFERAICLSDWSETVAFMGELDRAVSLVRESLASFEEYGSEGRRIEALIRLGTYLARQGDREAGRTALHTAFRGFEHNFQQEHFARAVDAYCELAASYGTDEFAATLAGFGNAYRSALNIPRPKAHQRSYDASLDQLRERLGGASFDAAFAEGTILQVAAVVERVLAR
ncbi:MAG: hypothetical protein JO199_02175, partial [Candidatus Eremiobacteraeota bacterium]|nr:hypothetical protein [Candidatus Eremiobacteraeota bacterium]